MKLIKPSVEIIDMKDGYEILSSLELYGRNCYKSEERITDNSALKFMQMIVHEKKHHSILRHEKAKFNLLFHTFYTTLFLKEHLKKRFTKRLIGIMKMVNLIGFALCF